MIQITIEFVNSKRGHKPTKRKYDTLESQWSSSNSGTICIRTRVLEVTMNRRQSVDTIADKWEVYLALTAVVLGGARRADGNPIVSYLPGHSSSQPSWLHCVYCTSRMTDKYFGFVVWRCGSSQHAARPRMGLSMSTMDAFQC